MNVTSGSQYTSAFIDSSLAFGVDTSNAAGPGAKRRDSGHVSPSIGSDEWEVSQFSSELSLNFCFGNFLVITFGDKFRFV